MYTEFKGAKHICLLVDKKSFAVGSALYTYALQLQKKVTFVMREPFHVECLSFLPWYEKLRTNMPQNCDLVYDVEAKSVELFDFFQEEKVNINPKMALALYASVLMAFDEEEIVSNGTILAVLQQLLKYGVDAKGVYEKVRLCEPLALVRFRSYMYANFVLEENAHCAVFEYEASLTRRYGVDLEQIISLLPELLKLVHVKRILLKEKETNRVLAEIRKEN